MTSPVIEAMARAMAKHASAPSDIGWRVYYGHAEAALKALEENITDEMVMAAMNADEPMEPYDAYRAIFTAMLRAARGE